MQDPDTSKQKKSVVILLLKDLILAISESSWCHYQEKISIRFSEWDENAFHMQAQTKPECANWLNLCWSVCLAI